MAHSRKADAGLDELLARVADLMAAEGAVPVNVLRLDEFDPSTLAKAGQTAAGAPRELAILHYSQAEAEKLAQDARLDAGLVFPLTLKVVEREGQLRLEADKFYLKAGDIDVGEPERVQRLIREVDELVDRVVGKA